METVLEQQENMQEDEGGVPVCGGNFVTAVTNTDAYIHEMPYYIGGRKYIPNAD